MPQIQEVGLFGRELREYVDAAEWPAVALVGALAFIYVGSFWLEVSYLNLMAPLVLIAQVITAVVCSYLVGVKGESRLGQVAVTCALVGLAGGVASALLALFRFWYPWLILNIMAEPVWSGLLSAFVGIITIGFFRLPRLLARWRQAPEQTT